MGIEISVDTKDEHTGWDALWRGMSTIDGLQLTVGVHDDAGREPNGESIVKVSAINEFGATIQHPGGTRYITDAVIKSAGGKIIGTRFVRKRFKGVAMTMGPHTIVIPARPWMGTTADNPSVRAGLEEIEQRMIDDVIMERRTVREALGTIGNWYQMQLQRVVRGFPWTPNAASTIRKKKSSQPLIASFSFVNAIKWRITSK